MRRAVILSAFLHALAAALLLGGGLHSGQKPAPFPAPALPLAKVELVLQDTSVVAPTGSGSVPSRRTRPAAREASESPANAHGASGNNGGVGFVTGPNVIPATPDSRFRNLPPGYPPEALRRGEAGTVVLTIRVAPDGHASAVTIAESSGFMQLDDAARDAVARWHFRPAVQDGAPVVSVLPMRVRFALEVPRNASSD